MTSDIDALQELISTELVSSSRNFLIFVGAVISWSSTSDGRCLGGS